MQRRVLVVAAIAVLFAMVSASAAEAKWLKAETPHFRIYGEGSEKQLRETALKLEDYDRLLRMLTGTQAPAAANKLEVYFVDSANDVKSVGNMGPNISGFYVANSEAVMAIAMRKDDWSDGDTAVLFHEYAHHFMAQYYPAAYPTWYVEGFAEYLATATFSKKQIEYGLFDNGRAYSLMSDGWITTERIFTEDLSSFKESQKAMFYAESWLIVHYIFRNDKGAALGQFMAERMQGVSEAAAFKNAFGMDFKAFDDLLRGYMKGKLYYSRFPRWSDQQVVEVSIEALPASANELILSRAALMRGLADDEGAVILTRVRQQAARFPGDIYAQSVLARAEIEFGDPRVGIAVLEPLLKGQPGVEILYLRGMADLQLAEAKGADRAALYGSARPWFARAYKADQNCYQAMYRYVQTLSLQPRSQNTVNVLLLAHSLAPQVREISFNAGLALLDKKDIKSARILLEPLANDPHGGRNAEQVRAILARAEGKVFIPAIDLPSEP